MIEKYKPLMIKTLLYLLGGVLLCGLLYVAYRFILITLPFLIALLISFLLEPLIQWLLKRTRGKIKRKPLAFAVTTLFMSMGGFLITRFILRFLKELNAVYKSAAEYYQEIYNTLISLVDRAKDIYDLLPAGFTENMNEVLSSFSRNLGEFVNRLIGSIFDVAGSLPTIIFFIIVTILATYFMILDRDRISIILTNSFSAKTHEKLSVIRKDILSALAKYFRAMAIICFITFSELLISFSIIGIRSPFVLAILIALFDILPIFGAGGILAPWAVYSLITGDMQRGLSLLLTYGVIYIVRQIIEPKIVGDQTGIAPIITLFAMYMGFRLLGVQGILLGPIITIILKTVISSMKKLKIDLSRIQA